MKEKFIDHKFNATSLKIIEIVNGILNEYRSMGYRLSLRQLYYQLVARDYIENSVKSYKRIGNLVRDARLAGLLDWNMIVDVRRSYRTHGHHRQKLCEPQRASSAWIVGRVNHATWK